jgi:hypothetical protein
MKKEYNPEELTDKMKTEVSELFRLCEEKFRCSLRSKSREQHYVNARMAFATIIRKKGYSYDRIGGFINRDHSTVVHYHKNIDMYLASDVFFKNIYIKINNDFNDYCIEKKQEPQSNFVDNDLNNNQPTPPSISNEELLLHIALLNEQKKDLHLTIEKLQIQNDILNMSESRVENITKMVKQRTRIGTEKEIEKKLHIWYNGVY